MKKIFLLTVFSLFLQYCFGDSGWEGEWYRDGLHASASITISAVKNNTFTFIIDAFSGANIGHLEGSAHISENTATAYLEDLEVKSEVHFQFTENTIEVKTINCEHYAGNGVSFDGNYLKTKVPVEQLAFDYLSTLLHSKKLAESIQKVTGYSFVTFAYCMHIVSEEKNLDSFPATVLHGCVQGICPYMQAIIMYTPDNMFFLAIIDNDTIYYFSSETDWKKKLPKTIQLWKDEFPELSVVFQ